MIPLKLDTLLKGRVVEQDRIEYKRGWNPSTIIHTICAYANDYNNTNGGYIVIGIEEEHGRPVLPPAGIAENSLDTIQKELFQYCNVIEPRYIPKIEILKYPGTDKWIIYLWCSAGENGPYKAPKDVFYTEGQRADRNKFYWIKPMSVTTIAKEEELSELFDKFNAVPFDDRVNRRAEIGDIRRGYLEDFLRESKSSLADVVNESTLEELLIAVEVANETDSYLAIRNIGLLMFSDKPEKFIPGAQIDMVRFNSSDAEASDDFIEKSFKGPIQKQLRDALDYLKTNVIEEKVIKLSNQAEVRRVFNYPYNALEEALVNAVFHKSYREPEPVEIRIYVDCIQIINYPGPAKWIDMNKFATGKVRARKYRNRRIGEFLKELDLSEKQSTGISKILKELHSNGSPEPKFETDDSRTYLITTIRIHEDFTCRNGMIESMSESMIESMIESLSELEANRMRKIIRILEVKGVVSSAEIAPLLDVTVQTARRLLSKAEKSGILTSTGKTKDKIYMLQK